MSRNTTPVTATQKAAALATSATAIAAIGPQAMGAITLANGFRPGDSAPPSVSYTTTRQFLWDVDGGGDFDFNFFGHRTYGASSTFDVGLMSSKAWRTTTFYGEGMVKPAESRRDGAIQNLPLGFAIGSSLGSEYEWGNPGSSPLSYLHVITELGAIAGADLIGGNFGSADNYVGFRFDIAGNIHYGWAQLALNSQQIVAGAYNDTPGGVIQVGQIPEPSSMALLGLGAAGLTMLRRRTKR